MAVEFFCKIDGAIIGPLSNSQLLTMASNGKLSPDDFIRTSNSNTWIKANKISGLKFNNANFNQTQKETTETTEHHNPQNSCVFLRILSNIYMGFGFLILILIPIVIVYLLVLHGGISKSTDAFEILLFIGAGSFSGVMMLAIGQSFKLAINTADNIHLLTQCSLKIAKQQQK